MWFIARRSYFLCMSVMPPLARESGSSADDMGVLSLSKLNILPISLLRNGVKLKG